MDLGPRAVGAQAQIIGVGPCTGGSVCSSLPWGMSALAPVTAPLSPGELGVVISRRATPAHSGSPLSEAHSD